MAVVRCSDLCSMAVTQFSMQKNRMHCLNNDECNRRFRGDVLLHSRKLQLTYSILSDNNSRRPGDRVCLVTLR